MTDPCPDAPGRGRLGRAAGWALALAASESLAAWAAGAREPGLFALQGALVLVAGLAWFALPGSPRVLAAVLLALAGAFHAGFAWHDVDRRLSPAELGMVALLAAVLLAVSLRALRSAGDGASPLRRPLALFACAACVQALWCARFVFPSTDTRAWLVPAAWTSAAVAPGLALLALRRLPARTALAAVALLGLAPLVAGRALFWHVHRLPAPAAGATEAPGPDVLLVVLDTVRADHLSLYGYPRRTTPELERFAARATVYEAAHSQAVWTLPGHASLFTGLYPSEHEAEWKDGKAWVRKLRPEAVTLAERFAAAGHRTACVSANAFLAPALGLAQGFEWLVTGRSPTVYLALPAIAMGLANLWNGPVARQRLGPLERTSTLHATEVNRLALEWLARTRGAGPRFLVLNYMEAHDPLRRLPCAAPRFGDGRACIPDNLPTTDAVWDGEARVSPADAQRLADWYDGQLACLDLHLGELLDELERRGLLDGMLVAITSDHGHLLGEHDAFDHEAEVWRELVHVPLVVKRPGQRSGARCPTPVETADLAAVLPWLAGLDLAHGPPDATRLAPIPTGDPGPLCPLVPDAGPVVAEAPERIDLARRNPRYATRWTALVDGPRKFFVDGRDRVLVADVAPGLEALREPTAEELARALELLERWRAGRIAPLGAQQAEGADGSAEAETLRLLEHQGYAGG